MIRLESKFDLIYEKNYFHENHYSVIPFDFDFKFYKS